MEYQFLACLKFAVTLKSSVYAKYYFNLRSVCTDASRFGLLPLTEDLAQRLEIRSKKHEDLLKAEEKDEETTTTNGGGINSGSLFSGRPLVKSESFDSYHKPSHRVVFS
eukprot:TRINITY_DN316_c0_g4_i1.p1 TRINITY_DN316_c0_g4~~TRINITY_DN316_c0_g4_i1.p1  ORF type:complete len:109 (-),score=29.72 TRINITY_DN316_c0_g4_i1:419-745(-)